MGHWSLIFAVVAMGMLVPAVRKSRGTTLLAPWLWALVSIASLAAAEAWIWWSDSPRADWVEPLRYAAALTTLCPVVALLGAKRPQDQAWQAIVVSLWAILALPAAENWLLHPFDPLVVHSLRQWFVAIVLIVGVVNWLGTRFWPSGILLFCAQWTLLSRWLPLAVPYDLGAPGAMGLIAAAAALVWLGFPTKRRTDQPLDRLWFDFRDRFGLVWALRLAERINSTAAMNNWDVHLGRDGFRSRAVPPAWQEMPAELEASTITTLNGMLRRFVSEEWIAGRMGQTLDRQ